MRSELSTTSTQTAGSRWQFSRLPSSLDVTNRSWAYTLDGSIPALWASDLHWIETVDGCRRFMHARRVIAGWPIKKDRPG